jgi:hypothetical protein
MSTAAPVHLAFNRSFERRPRPPLIEHSVSGAKQSCRALAVDRLMMSDAVSREVARN